MHPVLAVSTGTDVNRSPLTGTSAVFKVEDAMKQSGTKISSSVSASWLAHLNSPEAFPGCAAVSVVVPRGTPRGGACTSWDCHQLCSRTRLDIQAVKAAVSCAADVFASYYRRFHTVKDPRNACIL